MNASPTLIVGPSWVGDMVMAQALLKFLHARSPEQPLDVLAPAWSLPVVERMPEVRRSIASETGHGELGFRKRRRIALSLRDTGYAHAIVLPRSFKSALIPWIARIPKRTGFLGESRFGLINDVRPFDRDVLDQTVKRFVALGVEAGEALPDIPLPALTVSRERQQGLRTDLALDTGRPVIAMMPGAEYGPAKCWPLDYYAQLAVELDAAGYAVWVLGSDRDAGAGQFIAGKSPAIDLCGRTTLEDAIDVLGLCQQAVSNDSGLMHIACAVGIHVHGIYGSSSPGFTPPLTKRRDVHYLDIDCSPCFRRECPLKHLNCLREIRPTMVRERIEAVSAGPRQLDEDTRT